VVRTTEDLEDVRVAIMEAATTLAAARVCCLGVGYTAGSYFGGLAWDVDLREEISQQVGVPVATAASAIVAALGHLGMRTVAVVSPYAPAVNEQLLAYFAATGIEVSALTGEPPTGPAGEVPLHDISRMVTRLDLAAADGVLISCTGLRTMALLNELEKRTGRPVVSSNQALLWALGRAADLRLAAPSRLFDARAEE
jgi:maleate isomerase